MKNSQIKYELRNEADSATYGVAIDGRLWKTFASRQMAVRVAQTLRVKGKTAKMVIAA